MFSSTTSRDLAARNILVASEELVKISDFGLSRSVSREAVYVMNSTSNIPVKWLAPECLLKSTYTFASDVWGFGITLWEMFTYGRVPDLTDCQGFFGVILKSF